LSRKPKHKREGYGGMAPPDACIRGGVLIWKLNWIEAEKDMAKGGFEHIAVNYWLSLARVSPREQILS